MENAKVDFIRRFEQCVSRMCVTDTVALLHDTDPDGVTSGVIVAKAIERLRARPIDYVIRQHHGEAGITKDTIDFVKENKVQVLITVDKAIDQDPESLKECLKRCEVIVFDHHRYTKDLNEARCLFIKPPMFSDIEMSRYPTARMVYDLFFPLVDIRDTDWLMAVGTIADAAYKQWKFAIDGVFDRHQIPKVDDIYESELAKVAHIITSTIIVSPKDIPKLFETVYAAADYKEVLASPLGKHQKIFEAELDHWLNKAQSKAELYIEQKLIVYYITPKYNVKSVLSTLLSVKKYVGWTVVVAEEENGADFISLSIRNQASTVDCVDLIRDSLKDLDGASGGGHIPAVGGRVKKKDYAIFHDRLLRRFGIPDAAYQAQLKRISG
ncbi:DHH family phosphoesterase [Candidatus Woesearchaeota archaeon]|nr:DHH family phosphoesterase [Candidatus Woesearchaeota archaeon]